MTIDSMEGRPLEDAELVERARRGDVAAYEELVRTYQQLALRTAYVVAGNSADAQDAAQEAFVKAYYALGRFREGAAFRPWLLRIVANEAINRRRASRRKAALAIRAAEAGGRPSDGAAPSPEAAALALEVRAEVVSAMNRLREEDRLVIAYRYFLDLSEVEMAEALGCARGTVKSRLSRALKRLQRELPAGAGASAPALETGV
jgi:RNA polymerase sigma-70 factor (ECF subfamily)